MEMVDNEGGGVGRYITQSTEEIDAHLQPRKGTERFRPSTFIYASAVELCH